MWQVLIRKGLADIRSRPLETLTLVLVAMAASATLMLALLVHRSTRDSYEGFIEDANAGHAWFFSDPQSLAEISRMPSVVEYNEPLPALDGGRSLSTPVPYLLSFFAIDDSPPEVSFGVLTAGRWPSEDSDSDAVIDRGMASEAGLDIGDHFTVSARGGTAELQVVGLVIPTSRTPYPIDQYVRVFVSSSTLNLLAGGTPPYYAMGVRIQQPLRVDEFVSAVKEARGTQEGIGIRTWTRIRDTIADEQSEVPILLGVFSAFVLVAAILVVTNTVAARVLSYGREIAVLKTCGMTPLQIGALLTGQLVVLATLAAAAGVAVGQLMVPAVLGNLRETIGMAAHGTVDPGILLIPVGAVAGVVLVGCLLPAAAAARIRVAASLTGHGAGLSRRRGIPLPGFLERKGSPALAGIRDIFSSRMRAWLTVAVVAVAVATAVASLTLRESFEYILEEPQVIGALPVDFMIEPLDNASSATGDAATKGRITEAELTGLLAGRDDIDARVNRVYFAADVADIPVDVYAVGGDVERIGYRLVEGRLFQAPNEAIVGLGLATDLDLHPGDTLPFVPRGQDDHEYELQVAGVYVEDSNQGRAFSFDLENLRSDDGVLPVGTFAVRMNDGVDLDSAAAQLVAASGGRVVVRSIPQMLNREVSEVRDNMMPALNGLMFLMAVLALISLGGTLVKSVQERTREIGVLKTVGYTPGEIVRSVVSGAIGVSIVGAVIGAPLGWLFVRVMTQTPFADQGYDPGAIVQVPGAGWIAAMIVGIVFIAVVASAIPGRQAAMLRVAEAIRHE